VIAFVSRGVLVLAILLGVLTGAATGWDNSSSAGQSPPRTAPKHYLLLVNTAIAFMMTEAELHQFDQSAYDGLAIAPLHAYDTSRPPSVAAMDAEMREWKQFTHKDIWPWVYINRMIAMNPKENNPHSDTPYFRKIAGADLDDAEGAQSDFLALWRNAIASARDSKMPGIVFDQEFYNNYAEYDIGELSRESGKKPAEVVSKFEALGARMADIASQEYPDSVLWFLWTGLTHAGYKTYDGVSYYPSPTYIAIGLLDEIAQKRLRLRVLTGGEGSLGYCHDTLDDFRSAIGKRDSDMKSTLEKYSGILETAGTMTLWSDRRANQVCKTASAPTIEDLEPYLDLLFKSYRYNWIWASGDGGYLAFAPGVAPRFDAVIRRSKARSWTTPSTR